MNNTLTLEEQLNLAKIGDRNAYLKIMLRMMEGEATLELYHDLSNAPLFVKREAVRMMAKITIDYEEGHPTSIRYLRRKENVAPTGYLIFLGLLDAQ